MYKSAWMKIQMYLSSLLILFLLLFFLNLNIPLEFGEGSKFIGFGELALKNVIPISCLILIGISRRFVKTFNFKISSGTQEYFVLTKIKNKNYEHLTFLTTYIIPLIFFDLSKLNHILALILLLVVIGIIYIRTDIYYANPTLAIIGYYIYEADVKMRDEIIHESCILISRNKVNLKNDLEYLKIDDDIYFVKVKENVNG